MSIAAVSSDSKGSAAPAAADPRAGKYLTFQLSKEEFGIPVLQVREIMGLQDITAVPNTPNHVKGVINLRGRVIPVLCLRSRFGMEPPEYSGRTCIIVVKVRGEAGDVPLGVIVDEVSEVVNIAAADIENTPDFGVGVPSPYLSGMAKVKDRVKILLDIDQLLGQLPGTVLAHSVLGNSILGNPVPGSPLPAGEGAGGTAAAGHPEDYAALLSGVAPSRE